MRQKVEGKPTKAASSKPREIEGGSGPTSHALGPLASGLRKLNTDIVSGVVGFATSDFSQEVRMKKVLLVLTLVGLGFLAWRYFSNEPV
jgi:hypothetical protein